MVQVLHGLRRFSTAAHGWHLGVEGQCPDVVAFWSDDHIPLGGEPFMAALENTLNVPVVAAAQREERNQV